MSNNRGGNLIKKKITSIFFVCTLILSISSAAFAAGDTGFTDVSTDAWYAGAVAYMQETKLMDGVSEALFAPSAPASRIVLAAALYRAEGSPPTSGAAGFSDVAADTENGDAVAWAAENGIVNGYGNGLFGANDPITREQIATIFWRWAGQPDADGSAEAFSDQSSISGWAGAAVAWAWSNGVINGKSNNIFDPQGTAARAEVATVLMNYLTRQTENPAPQPELTGKSLVVYFSLPETTSPDNMTQEEENSTVVIDGEVLGNTQYVAYIIQENTGADIFRIEPKTPYPINHATLVDLASREQAESARPELAANAPNIDQYDTIFLGYPNWWGDMPMILYSFLESVDLSGKTIIPFNTHGGSGFSDTINTISKQQPNATVENNGFTVSRNSVQFAESDVAAWLRELDFVE